MKNRRASRLVSLVRMASVLATAAFSLGVRAGTLDLAVRDRAPEYTIVHAADASPSVKYAARELRDFTERMTGVRLPIADSAPSSGKAVFLDPPRLASGVSRPSDLGEDGFLLKAEAGNVYVFGGRRGVLYGVYELLEKFGGCRWYASWHTVVPQREAFSVPGDLNDAQHVGVREAELRMVLDALALHHAEILGVLAEVLLGRKKVRERVAAAKALAEASRGASVSRTQAHRRSVRAIVRGKVAVEHVPPERLAVRKRGFLRIVQIAGH